VARIVPLGARRRRWASRSAIRHLQEAPARTAPVPGAYLTLTSEEARDGIDREFGRLDVLVNNAGILRFEHSHEVAAEDWDRMLRINLTGTFQFCQAAIPVMVAAGRGAIVNVASTAAQFGHPWAAAYAASKGGVLALTRTLAVEYAKQGLRVNAVCPGSIDTPITEAFSVPAGADPSLVRRIMAPVGPSGPEPVAAAIAYLASDDAAHVIGADVRIDGATHS
jgi:NAD(P)-dependent dehydrogenase (short-subunit alcohol dehydrogenase family)